MIGSKLRITAVVLGVFALLFHFTMLLVYRQGIAPKSKPDFYSLAYVYPFFQQSWQLFAPPPESNYRLYASFECDGKQKKDIFSEILETHQSNRLLGYEPLILAFTNSIHYFEKNTSLRKPLNGPIMDDLYFIILEHDALNYLKYTYGEKVRNVRLILVVNDFKTGESRVYFDLPY